MIQVNPGTITRLTSGEANPELSTIEQVAGALGVTASEILRGPDDQVLVTIEQAFEILEQARKDERAGILAAAKREYYKRTPKKG